jgi:peptidoglycan biosynthesis protein MviN/MurJ (putative lipid II flippase)
VFRRADPELLQNLLGEGVLSASFIPVCARPRAEGPRRRREPSPAVGSLLVLVANLVALAGVLAAEPLVIPFAPVQKYERELQPDWSDCSPARVAGVSAAPFAF